MTEAFYVDSDGKYLGCVVGRVEWRPLFDEDDNPVLDEDGNPTVERIDHDPIAPEGGIVVSSPPENGAQIYNFSTHEFNPYVPPIVGTPDAPLSITMTDTATGLPVTIQITNGQIIKTTE